MLWILLTVIVTLILVGVALGGAQVLALKEATAKGFWLKVFKAIVYGVGILTSVVDLIESWTLHIGGKLAGVTFPTAPKPPAAPPGTK